MKFILFGKDGQLGIDLHKYLKKYGEVDAFNKRDGDITDKVRISALINELQPDVIINAAAYTNVDEAETQTELANKINNLALEDIGKASKKIDALVIHFSTDYVFDGNSHEPYKEKDLTNPLNYYGQSKLSGEKKLKMTNPKHLILRTSWVASPHGKSFVNTILGLARTKKEISVIADQFGSPISTNSLALNTINLIKKYERSHENFSLGTFHFSSKGPTTWYEYAKFIVNEGKKKSLELKLEAENIIPINSLDYGNLAPRPPYSYLDCTLIEKTFDLSLPFWKDEISYIIDSVKTLD